MGIIRLTRKELYEKVWSEPIVKLAREYGFSDVWLARICKRNNIPRPSRGYWARVQTGQGVSKTPLPKGDNDRIIEIYTHDPGSKGERIVSRKKSTSKRLLKSIVLPESQMDPHPLILESAKKLESTKQDITGLVPPQKGCLNINVSRDSLPRALNLMDSLIKMLTMKGFEVSLSGKETEVKIDGVSLSLSLCEELDRKRRLRAADHNLEGYYEFGYRLFDKRAYPSGRLSISIDGFGFDCQGKRTWRDTESKKLENYLKGIVLGLIRMAALKKVHLLEKKEDGEEKPSNI